MKMRLTYLGVFLTIFGVLTFIPKTGGYIWQAEIINPLTAVLFTLLIWLVGRVSETTQTAWGVVCTTIFVLLFCPDSRIFFNRDETAIVELISVSIVPFFMSQYNRISSKNFKYGYFLMLLMGVFCSYTHDSITIPLCASFLTLSYVQRRRLFRLACWPMVIGFVIGTALSIIHSEYLRYFPWNDLNALSSQTASGLSQLWETKVVMFATLLTIYFLSSRRKRKTLWRISRQHQLITYCLLYSICAVPFAPLGLDSAIEGACFFCMFWVMFLFEEVVKEIKVRRQEIKAKKLKNNRSV